jgi:hypothetical protein
LDGFEGLQGLWTDGGGGWDYHDDMRNISTNFGWSNTATFWIQSWKVYTATVTRDDTKGIEEKQRF